MGKHCINGQNKINTKADKP